MGLSPVPEVGTKFGRLSFQRLAGRRLVSNRWVTLWQLICICGTIRVIPAVAVRAHRARSCGCLQREKVAEHCRGQRDLICKDCGKAKPDSTPIYMGRRCYSCHRAWERDVQTIKHREKIRDRLRKWIASNRDRFRLRLRRSAHARRARMSVSASDVTYLAWRHRLEEFGHACAYCLRTDVPMSQDHILAISRGGLHLMENLVPACTQCTSRKNNRGILSMVNQPIHDAL